MPLTQSFTGIRVSLEKNSTNSTFLDECIDSGVVLSLSFVNVALLAERETCDSIVIKIHAPREKTPCFNIASRARSSLPCSSFRAFTRKNRDTPITTQRFTITSCRTSKAFTITWMQSLGELEDFLVIE